MFLSVLLLMDERGWIRAEKWKTNREYVDELTDRKPKLCSPFIEGAALFEHVVYGAASASADDYVRMQALEAAARGGDGHDAEIV
ncbi:hypothetical protein D3C73_1484420 [compost metagenome]